MTTRRPGIRMEPATASLDDGTLSRQPGGSRVIAGIDPGSKTSSLRQRLPVMLTEKECGRFFTKVFGPELQDFVDCKVELTLIFTNGKDTCWSELNSSPSAKGVMTGAFLIPKSRIAAGGALLDLRACVGAASAGRASLSVSLTGQTSIHMRNASLGDLRYEVLAVVAHEMFHMIQAWRAGDTLDGEKIKSPSDLRYTKTFLRLMKEVRREHPKYSEADLRAATRARHPSEKEAEALARGRLEHHRWSIKNGAWDECLPIEALKSFLQ